MGGAAILILHPRALESVSLSLLRLTRRQPNDAMEEVRICQSPDAHCRVLSFSVSLDGRVNESLRVNPPTLLDSSHRIALCQLKMFITTGRCCESDFRFSNKLIHW